MKSWPDQIVHPLGVEVAGTALSCGEHLSAQLSGGR